MESIETGLRLFVFIIVISLFFALIGFIVRKYLSGFFEGFVKKIATIFRKTD
ncbi:hypothetical protein FHS16_005439 [Paenibacillus endophyticus]|uniref:Uncharacterized protein n=1 Tax=Paenibacillus endophyticus TaxID=1294268 RepID=A0A7W5CCR4_9BACL|nr:hypothetical protein [Paenibacillus endophyticus]